MDHKRHRGQWEFVNTALPVQSVLLVQVPRISHQLEFRCTTSNCNTETPQLIKKRGQGALRSHPANTGEMANENHSIDGLSCWQHDPIRSRTGDGEGRLVIKQGTLGAERYDVGLSTALRRPPDDQAIGLTSFHLVLVSGGGKASFMLFGIEVYEA